MTQGTSIVGNGTGIGKTPFQETMDQVFLMTMALLIQLMQCGFAFLEVGCVRSKNVSSILMKTVLDAFVAGVAYWTVGYAFAYGEGNEFIGWNHFATSDLPSNKFAYFFYEFVIASTASTIVSGAVAERCEMVAYLVYSFVITGFIYPIVSRWAWSPFGWLYIGQEYMIDNSTVTIKYHDFAGSGVVHAVGGTASFFGALILGPRLGRFHPDSKDPLPMRGHSLTFASLGILILFIGFLAFNGGSQMSVSNPGDGDIISLAAVNTVLSAATCAYLTLIIHKIGILGRSWNVMFVVNGSLSGMVAICTGCDLLRPWAAIIVGAVTAVSFNFTAWLMWRLKIDDPVDAIAVHFGGGVWGTLSIAFLDYENGILRNWNYKSGLILGWQLAGILSIIAWTGVLSSIMFGLLKITGFFRVPEEIERKGLDVPKYGGPAYPLDAYGHGHVEKIPTVLENGELSCFSLGYINDSMKGTSDTGPYECPEIKAMNNMPVSFIPDVQLIVTPPEDGCLNRKNGQINPGFVCAFERTAL
ncbi:unnamed protein product [Candidula unifasciata]|uniref:Ammonium transporter n=1 Tax=Candidula unifasciata TaxID=100452 RepID=A0A8S4A9W3_9EUPU|nr:unnamed protein product [Candidula unifasciata]